jgi:hypothetical protein
LVERTVRYFFLGTLLRGAGLSGLSLTIFAKGTDGHPVTYAIYLFLLFEPAGSLLDQDRKVKAPAKQKQPRI